MYAVKICTCLPAFLLYFPKTEILDHLTKKSFILSQNRNSSTLYKKIFVSTNLPSSMILSTSSGKWTSLPHSRKNGNPKNRNL